MLPSRGVAPTASSTYSTPRLFSEPVKARFANLGALIFRIGFWGLLYYSYNREPHKTVLVNI